ncbi:MAG TPA: glycosyltransferase family 4 protein [Bryobacteraceae bacterium]|jgi:glycosyltransferase involved in cell wall biosynthesis|nr:glycosyltransferase family 4 protein [Bryobacteraceae bacterium]
MRILLTSNASYAPARGGSTRSNLVWLRHLADHGHACRVVCTSLREDAQDTTGAIQIHSVKKLVQRRSVLESHIRDFYPDFVLVSSEDLSHLLLGEATRVGPDRIVYLAHTPQFFPFGAESWNRDARATEMIRSARAVVAIGHSTAAYIEQATRVNPAVIHPPIYGQPPFARLGCFDRGAVLMINPCQVKGIGIFVELARRFPDYPFAALAGWGTTTADRKALEVPGNVRLIESVDNIEEALAQARVLLMPSLWYEGFGLIAMEAMLRGIPVISSDSGGLVEARQGTGFVIPVRRIQRYLFEFDETHMPRPVIPEQDLEPWTEALNSLLGDRNLYAAESERCRTAALNFVARLDASDLEKLLLSLGASN